MPDLDDPRIRDGLAAQATARQARLDGGATRLGWKAGLGTAAAMERVGTRAPVVGFLTSATLVPDGGEVDVAGWDAPMLEAEVAVRLGRDLPAGADRDQALAAVEAIAPAIELVDLGAPDDLEAVLAGNVFHRAVLLGAFAPCPAGAGLAAARLDVHVGTAEGTTGVDPALLLGDLADVLRALADQLPAADAAMRAGDVIITGAAIAAIPLTAGARAHVALAGGAAVSVAVR
jgi:2-oxo-3-hexenedioate decarboxylase